MKKLVNFLIKNNLTISSCESFTGGMFSSMITDIKNSSEVFFGSFICYSNKYKKNILKLSKKIFKKNLIVSELCSKEMLFKTYKKTKTDIVVSFTGYAPPTSHKDAGLCYVGILFNGKYKIIKPSMSIDNSRENFKKDMIELMVIEIFNFIN